MTASAVAEHLNSLLLSSEKMPEIVVDNPSLHPNPTTSSTTSSSIAVISPRGESVVVSSQPKVRKRRSLEPSSKPLIFSDDETDESYSEKSELDELQIKNFADHIAALLGNKVSSPSELPIVSDNHRAHPTTGGIVQRSKSYPTRPNYNRSLSAPSLNRHKSAPYGSTDPYKKMMRWGEAGGGVTNTSSRDDDATQTSSGSNNAKWDMPSMPARSRNDQPITPPSGFRVLAEAKDSRLCLKGMKNTAARSSLPPSTTPGNASWEIGRVNALGPEMTLPLKPPASQATAGSLSQAKDSHLCLKGIKNSNTSVPMPKPLQNTRRGSGGNVKDRLAAIVAGSLGKPVTGNASWENAPQPQTTVTTGKASAAVLSQLGIALPKKSGSSSRSRKSKSSGHSTTSSKAKQHTSQPIVTTNTMRRSNSEQRWSISQSQRKSDSELSCPKRSY